MMTNDELYSSTYDYEQQLYLHVREGDPEKLLDYMIQWTWRIFNRGHLADEPLRNAKNRFIVAATKLLTMSALPEKMDVEAAYTLTNGYILKAEKSDSMAQIERLEYVMIMDFCRRIGAGRTPSGISSETESCMSFIREHIHERISVGDVAAHLGKSLSYVHNHFKKETGYGVRDYIMLCKLEEAVRLLKYTDKSLGEISADLSFSSQSYFQNVFRKEYGVTPMQFRKENQT